MADNKPTGTNIQTAINVRTRAYSEYPDAKETEILQKPSLLNKILRKDPPINIKKIKIKKIPSTFLGTNRGEALKLHAHAERRKLRNQPPVINAEEKYQGVLEEAAKKTEQESAAKVPGRESMKSNKKRKMVVLEHLPPSP
jgi:hypothetical protein